MSRPGSLALCSSQRPNGAHVLRGDLCSKSMFTFVGPRPKQPSEVWISPSSVHNLHQRSKLDSHSSRLCPSGPDLPGQEQLLTLGVCRFRLQGFCFCLVFLSPSPWMAFVSYVPQCGGSPSVPEASTCPEGKASHGLQFCHSSAINLANAVLSGPLPGATLFPSLSSTPRVISSSQGKCSCIASVHP